MEHENLYGRLHTWPKNRPVPEGAQVLPVRVNGRCFRCAGRRKALLPHGQSYCLDCLMIGRVSSLDCFLTIPEANDFAQLRQMRWQGQLTERQQEASAALLENLKAGRDQLLFAVTGAGKTEMLFPILDWALGQRMRIAFVAPRVDVVLELAPRIQAAFEVTMQVLYGDQVAPYQYSQLVLATTHQLMRFYRAFDLVIIDEVDAFPYRGNKTLERAIQQAKKEQGRLLWMTATASPAMLRAVKKQKLILVSLPARFHGGPLPNLQVVYAPNWSKRLPGKIEKRLRQWLKEQKPFFVFVPKVADLERVCQHVQRALGNEGKGETVHAKDPNRLGKVAKMRAGDFDFLVTTTILERGVTLSNLQVLILGADDPTFTREALVQMAGRVGRDKNHSDGDVLAVVSGPSRRVKAAQKEIRLVNERAERRHR